MAKLKCPNESGSNEATILEKGSLDIFAMYWEEI